MGIAQGDASIFASAFGAHASSAVSVVSATCGNPDIASHGFEDGTFGDFGTLDGDDFEFDAMLSAYYNKADTSRSGWNPSEDYREMVRGIIPNDVQELIRQNCPTTDELDEKPTGFPVCALPDIDYDEISRLFQPLKANVEFQRILTYRHSELGVMIYLLTQQVTFADGVLAQIAQQ